MTLAILHAATVPDTLTASESKQLGGRIFSRLADGKIPAEHTHRVLKAGQVFLEHAEARDSEDWQQAAAVWRRSLGALGSDALRLDLEALTELTEEHHELVMDPSRNPVFNSGRLSLLFSNYLKKYPRNRPSNLMGRTLLYAARPGCRHKSDGRFSGVGCANCPGWFCL